MVGRGVMKEPGDCLVVMEAIFRILVEQSHVRWAQAHHHPEVDGVLQVTGGHAGQGGYESVYGELELLNRNTFTGHVRHPLL